MVVEVLDDDADREPLRGADRLRASLERVATGAIVIQTREALDAMLVEARKGERERVIGLLYKHEHDGGGALYGSEFAAYIRDEGAPDG